MTAFAIKGRLAIILLFVAASVFGQQNFQLSQLVDAAFKYYPIIKQKEALYKASNASLNELKHSFLPQIKLSDQINFGTDNSISGSMFPLGITPSSSGGIRASNNMQSVLGSAGVVYAEYELYNFGANKYKVSEARSTSNLQLSELQRDKYLLSLQVAKLYLTLIQIQLKLQVDNQNVNRYDSIFKVIRAITISGLKPGADSSLAKAELSKAKISLNNTKRIYSQLKEQLFLYTGIPPDQIAIENSKFLSFQIPEIDNSLTDIISNPVIEYYKNKRNVLILNNQVINRTYLPKVSIEGSYWARGSSIQYNDMYTSLRNGFDFQRTNYLIGVSVSYNLLNVLYRRDKLKTNKYQKEAVDYEIIQQENQMKSALAQSIISIGTSKLNLHELPVQIKSANDTYLQKIAQYRAGVISLIDLTNASFVLYRSHMDWLETLNDFYNAALDKATAEGNLNDFIKNFKF
jgi:outer membrane protein TolC